MQLDKRNSLKLLAVTAAIALVGACSSMSGMPGMAGKAVTLTGAQEVPPITTSAAGTGRVTIAADGAVTARITLTGMTTTAAHIHTGAAGTNGPVIVPFTKVADNVFEAAPGAKLTDTQMASYKAGNLYVNAHSAAHPGGEVRAQLTP